MSLPKKILVPAVIVYVLLLAVLGQALLFPAPPPQALRVDRFSLAEGQERARLSGAGFDQTTQLFLSLDTGNKRLHRTVLPTYGRGGELLRVGNFAYLANYQRGLTILDVTEPLRPRLVGTVPLPGRARTITVANHVAYVGCGEQGLAVVDVGEPTAPRLLTTLAEVTGAQGMMVLGQHLYVTIYTKGVAPALAVFDLSEPGRPRPQGHLPLSGQPIKIAAVGQQLCVAAGEAGLHVLALDDAGFPRLVARLPLSGSTLAVAGRDRYAYVASSSGTLTVVDLAGPAPRVVTTLSVPGNINHLLVEKERLYAVGGNSGGHVLDLGEPWRPRLTGYFEGPRSSLGLAAAAEVVYLVVFNGGIHVLDLRAPEPLQATGRLSWGESVQRVVLRPQLAFVTTDKGHLYVLDRSNPQEPTMLGALDLHGQCHALALNDEMLFAYLPSLGLQLIDISDPRQPRAMALYPHRLKKGVGALAVDGPLALLAGNDNELLFLDVGRAGPPRLQGVMPLPEKINNLAMRAGLICATTVSGKLLVIDAATRRLRGSLALPVQQLSDLALADGLAVLVGKRDGLLTVDLTDHDAPRLRNVVPLDLEPSEVLVQGTTAYVTARHGGVQIIDLTDPGRPGPGSHTPILHALATDAEHLYLAASYAGLLIVPLPRQLAVTLDSPGELSFELPPVPIDGHYSLRVDNGSQTITLPGVLQLSAQR